jgi:hypothetical protein
MNVQQQVTVYNFRSLDSGFESAPVSSYKATRQYIVGEVMGDPLEATAELVAVDDVDASGCYRRRFTAWGDLS